jgi:hypothetical protein
MVHDTMQYGDDGQLLDVAPYPAIYEYAAQQKYEYDHPERMWAIHQLAQEQMVQAKLRMADKLNENRPDRAPARKCAPAPARKSRESERAAKKRESERMTRSFAPSWLILH